MASSPKNLDELNARIVTCDRCSRLREHCTQIASVRRRAYADWEYWGRPVPSFGDPRARVLIRTIGALPGGNGDGQLAGPRDAATDPAGNIYVAEWLPYGRVTKLRKVSA